MNETAFPIETPKLEVESFLDDARMVFDRFYMSPEEQADKATAGRHMLRPTGYLERLFNEDADVTSTDRLLDTYVSGVVLDMPEMTEKANLLLRELLGEKELSKRIFNETFSYAEKEGRVPNKRTNVRFMRLKAEKSRASDRIQLYEMQEKEARRRERAANPHQNVILRVAHVVGQTAIAKAFLLNNRG